MKNEMDEEDKYLDAIINRNYAGAGGKAPPAVN